MLSPQALILGADPEKVWFQITEYLNLNVQLFKVIHVLQHWKCTSENQRINFWWTNKYFLFLHLAVIHMRLFNSCFCKKQKVRMISYARTRQITFPVRVIGLCICSFPKGKRFSQPFGDTVCWQKTENLLERNPFSFTCAYDCFSTKQGKEHNCLILQYYLKVSQMCFHWIIEKFFKSIILRTVIWMWSQLRVQSLWRKCVLQCLMESSLSNLNLVPWKWTWPWIPKAAIYLFQRHKKCFYLHIFLLEGSELPANTGFQHFSHLFLAKISKHYSFVLFPEIFINAF